jgi:hypothetical protein
MPKNETTLVRSLWSTYASLARKRGYDYHLSFERFAELTKQNCFYCGVEPAQILKPRIDRPRQAPYVYNGVDRKDNLQGYSESNAVACCGMCNAMKSSYTETMFLKHIAQITEYQNSKKSAEMTDSTTEVVSNN